jgi:nucleoside-diphosphate-sugar epimerase
MWADVQVEFDAYYVTIASADSFFTQKLASKLQQAKIPIVGNGDNLFCLVHTDDAAEAFVIAAEKQLDNPGLVSASPIFHLTDDQPQQMATGWSKQILVITLT